MPMFDDSEQDRLDAQARRYLMDGGHKNKEDTVQLATRPILSLPLSKAEDDDPLGVAECETIVKH